MKHQPRVTVVTVTYNALDALSKTMRSVEAQDYANIEYIIVDGASSDATPSMLAQYHGRLNRWVSEKDRGIYDAMNKGVKMSTGEYVIFMNAGDTFVGSDTVSRVFAEAAEADVIYGDIMKNGMRKRSLSPRNCHKMYYCHQAAFTRRECLLEMPFDVSHRFSADFKQAKEMFLAGKTFSYVDVAVADFDTSGVSNVNRSQGLWDNVKVVCETDSFINRMRFLPHLLFPFIICKIRGK